MQIGKQLFSYFGPQFCLLTCLAKKMYKHEAEFLHPDSIKRKVNAVLEDSGTT